MKEIDRYLGRLEAHLEGRVHPQQMQALLEEVENHLVESIESQKEDGMAEDLATRLALDSLGPPREYASEWAKQQAPAPENIQLRKQLRILSMTASTLIVLAVVFGSTLVSSLPLSLIVTGSAAALLIFTSTKIPRTAIRLASITAYVTAISCLGLFLAVGRYTESSSGRSLLGLQFGDQTLTSAGFYNPYSPDNLMVDWQKESDFIHSSWQAHVDQTDLPTNADGKYLQPSSDLNKFSYHLTNSHQEAKTAWETQGLTFIDQANGYLASKREYAVLRKTLPESNSSENLADVAKAVLPPTLASLLLIALSLGTGFTINQASQKRLRPRARKA